MAKTKPIGVRFDEELLNKLKAASIVNSAQKALNLYEKCYVELVIVKVEEKMVKVVKDFLNKNEPQEKLPTDIEKQIAAIKTEKIPENRNTLYGRKVWEIEQQTKIDNLKNVLK